MPAWSNTLRPRCSSAAGRRGAGSQGRSPRTRGTGAGSSAQIDGTRELIAPAPKTVAEVESADVGALPQEVLRPLIDAAVHRRQHHADAALALAEVLRRAE